MLLFVKETGQLIECGEKNAKEGIEEMKSANGMNGQEEGKKQEICWICTGDTKTVCRHAIVYRYDQETNRKWRKECRIKH